ncbi:MAG: carboxypeptidase-like regulatory domain-containing protein [Flavobacteriales bacterium]|nr:carboxypeptidase-like regulatory domain-containing protein [Flavobacteriales bacterium]HQV75287.1 carboxypeptidase-like regulatory domain-containing protein [Flavobacteriales bacterium]HQW41016.1 carboxypeptidase-like regulatory domain-containing protein [Flavobacteriales bacterium]
MYRTLTLCIALFLGLIAFAQRGTVAGTITANEGGIVQPMPFVNVAIKGTSTGGTTDLDGKFSFDADAGEHVLLVSFVGYEAVEKTITVIAGQTVNANHELKSQAIEMKTVEVVTTRRTETESAVVMETRQSEQVVNGMGREQISKGQDRTAGDVVKRIPGVTMVGDRFVMIRGLADRYNTVMLNDVIAPSMEPDRRAFSFDILPSGALDRVMVYKTGAPELPGEFAGGVIKLYTINVPSENSVKVDYSTSLRNGTTFKPFYSSQQSGTDALGFDNGLRQLPSKFPGNLYHTTPERLTAAGKSLANNWTADESSAAPDQRFGISLTKRFGQQGGRVNGGNITSINYSNTRQSYTANNQNYNVFDPSAQRSERIYDYNDNENIHQVRISALSNFSLLVGTRTKLEFRNLFTQQGTDQATLRTGKSFEEQFEVKNYAFRYQQRSIYSGQLHGEHELTTDVNKLSWTLGYGLGISKEPDFRRVRTVRDLNTTDADIPFQVIVPPGATTLDAGRFFSNMNENVMTGKVDYEHQLKGERNKVKIRVGAFVERKDRTFSARWMSFKAASSAQFDQTQIFLPLDQIFSPEHINTTDGFKLEEGTNPSDRYTAANTLLAGYVGTTINLATNTVISAGVRAEHNTQELKSATFGGARVLVNNPLLSILPSINLSRSISEKSQVRLAWATTVNRPEFRELAPFAFYDFSFNNVLRGNEELNTATIQNVDARYELYPSSSEVFSFGVFYKHFTNPIEMFFLPGAGSGGTRNFTFGNAQQAQSVGAELELRRSLNSIFTAGYMSRVGVMFNAAYIVTEVTLGEGAEGQAQKRPLMGQSPYIVNAGLYYQDTEHKLQYNIMYNVIGPRLFAVGTYGTPDIYEMPRNVVDVTLTKGIGKRFEVKLSAQDILNQRTRLIQDSNGNGKVDKVDEDVLSFRRGSYFSIGLGLKL